MSSSSGGKGEMSLDALIIDSRDNVATAVRGLDKGEVIQIGSSNQSVRLCESIPMGHKLALKDIGRGQPVVKYGEIIGLATRDILTGEHVHVHNVEGRKGRGDRA